MIGNTQEQIRTIKWRHIAVHRVTKRANGECDGTTFSHPQTKTILLNPAMLIRRGMICGGELKTTDKVMGHKILPTIIVKNHHCNLIFDLTVVCKEEIIRASGRILGHKQQIGIWRGGVREQNDLRI
jgi:hypothetical protein